MKKFISSALVAALSLAVVTTDVSAREELPELTKSQTARLESFMYGVYNLNTLEGPFSPYICWYSLFWDEYYVPVEQGMRELLAPLTQKQRNDLDRRLFNLAAWWVTLDELGCGDYDPTKIYDLLEK